MWTVCDDGTGEVTTIQEAIDAAGAGEVITVCSGTYNENLDFSGAAVTVLGEGWETTILRGVEESSPTTVAWFPADAGDCHLEGFTITGGRDTRDEESLADYRGGAILIYGSSPVIQGNRIEANAGYWGPGMIVYGAASHPTVVHNEFVDNLASNDGGAILVYEASITLNNNLFSGNVAGNSGAALYLGITKGGEVKNNTLVNNAGSGHVYIYSENLVSFRSNIVAYSARGPAVARAGGSTLDDCQYNDFYGNAGGDITSSTGFCLNATNIGEDPAFVDYPAADFTLQAGSPCVDVGDIADTDPDGSRADMGAYGGAGGGAW
jgi:hypothetical protein